MKLSTIIGIPEKYCFRGDEALWILFSNMEYSKESYSIALKTVENLFKDAEYDKVFVEMFEDVNGMSGRCISKSWWFNKGLPLIKSKIDEFEKSLVNNE